jgi:hypothetical protein
VVIKGELPTKEEMGDGLYEYIKANTYLSWDDPWFWKKLRYALPHKSAQSRFLEHLFGLNRTPTDQLNLLGIKAAAANGSGGGCNLNVLTSAPSTPRSDVTNQTTLSAAPSISGRHNNSVSPDSC